MDFVPKVLILAICLLVKPGEENKKKTRLINGAVIIIAIAYIGSILLMSERLNQATKEKYNEVGATQLTGSLIRASKAFWSDEGRLAVSFSEIVNKYRGTRSAYISGSDLVALESSDMKLSGYNFDMKLADNNTIYISAIPIYKGNHATLLTVVGVVSINPSSRQAEGKICKSKEFTYGSIEFPTRDSSGQLSCPSDYTSSE